MNKLKEYISKSSEDTKNIAKEIILEEIKNILNKSKNEEENKCEDKNEHESFQKVINIILDGDLAAGKTKFTEGVLELFNMQNEISSPTFTIVNEYFKNLDYNVQNEKIKVSLNHFDVYRLEDEDEFFESGLKEYLYPENVEKDKINIKINLIEWGMNIEEVFPKPYILVKIIKEEINFEERKIEIYK